MKEIGRHKEGEMTTESMGRVVKKRGGSDLSGITKATRMSCSNKFPNNYERHIIPTKLLMTPCPLPPLPPTPEIS